MSLPATKQRQSWRATTQAQINSALDTKLGKFPVRWYLSGWRIGISGWRLPASSPGC